jgi:hypothetical protein
MIILGLSGAVSHDPSAALYVDGQLVAAAITSVPRSSTGWGGAAKATTSTIPMSTMPPVFRSCSRR